MEEFSSSPAAPLAGRLAAALRTAAAAAGYRFYNLVTDPDGCADCNCPSADCHSSCGLSLAAFFSCPPADGLLPAALLTEAPLVRAERLTDRRPVFRAALCLVSLGASQASLGDDALAICRSLTGCGGILAACDFSCAARPGPTLNGARAVDARFEVIMDL